MAIIVMFMAAATAHADPLAIRKQDQIPLRVQIELPATLSAVRFGLRLGNASAIVEPHEDGLGLLLQSLTHPSLTAPQPMERLERFLNRSPVALDDETPSSPGLQLQLLTPGDVGISVKYRW